MPRFVDHLKLFRLGVSWGGYESLVYPAAASYSAGVSGNAVRDFAVPKTLIRLHVGLEGLTDLLSDLKAAFSLLQP